MLLLLVLPPLPPQPLLLLLMQVLSLKSTAVMMLEALGSNAGGLGSGSKPGAVAVLFPRGNPYVTYIVQSQVKASQQASMRYLKRCGCSASDTELIDTRA